MSSMNYDGTVRADCTYTDKQLTLILGISDDQLLEYYKDGLLFFQRTRKQPRQTTGSEYHRFIERRLGQWPDDEDGE